jgi:alpha-glucuronidase
MRASAPEGQPACSSEWTYSGPPGNFDLAMQYFDLQGGSAKFKLDINGQTISTWSADAALPSKRPHGDNSTRFTAHGVARKPGDVIRVEGMPDGSDPAAMDYVEVLL